MHILSIQSAVTYGHVGNSAAVFPLQRLGHEVWPVYTVTFSNHTGYGEWTGRSATPEEIEAIVDGVDQRGALETVDLVLSGYLGDPALAAVVARTVQRVKTAHPGARYACDPVMGNADTGCFVRPEIPETIKDELISLADIVSPNQFELGFLTGTTPTTLDEILDAAQRVHELGPDIVLVTSVTYDGQSPDVIGMIASSGSEAWLVETPKLPMHANGSGDLVMALFVGYLGQGAALSDALAWSAGSVFHVLQRTLDGEDTELKIIESQDDIASPETAFPAVDISLAHRA